MRATSTPARSGWLTLGHRLLSFAIAALAILLVSKYALTAYETPTGDPTGVGGFLLLIVGGLLVTLVAFYWRSLRLLAEAREDQQRWEVAGAAGSVALWTWDIVADEFWTNEHGYALLGQTQKKALTFAEFVASQHPDDQENSRKLLRQILEGKRQYETEFRIRLPNGELRWLAARGKVNIDEHGKAVGVTGVWIQLSAPRQQVNETGRLRSELIHMSRVAVLGEVAGSLAHEINQPLAAILCNAQAAQRFLEQSPIDTNELREILRDIADEDRRAGEVIRRIRSMLKDGASETQLVDVNTLVQEVLALLHSDLIARKVSVQTTLPQGLPPVDGDPIQIQQVLTNLILNGCEAMQEAQPLERKLLLDSERDGSDQVRISVRDRGFGVAAAMLETIFEPFVTSKKNGLGMGLAVCRSIVTAHGGRIWAARNKDRGLTVAFTLKVHA
jgi:C4-dicarboxylate-specific signal transduction histidine kinase